MAPILSTPRRSGAGRPRKSTARPRSSGSGSARTPTAAPANSASEPPKKKRRYIPGGPGGGGRYVDEDGTEIPVGGTGPGGYNYVGPRGRIGRENAANGVVPVEYPRRDRSTRTRTVMPRSQQPAMRFTSAAQAAAAVVQNDGYKPREERGWEEFHPNLDIEAKLMVFTADEVDGIQKSRPVTPADRSASGSVNGTLTPNGDKSMSIGQLTPTGSLNGEVLNISIPGTPGTKRKPGRPPKDPIAFFTAKALAAQQRAGGAGVIAVVTNGTPTSAPRIAPLQNQNAKERLTLPQPSYRKVDTFSKFEDKASGLVRYVDKSMAKVGYQESDEFIRPATLIKYTDSNLDEELDLASGGVGRVEYDMDEQDDKWLEEFNAQRKSVGIEPITREIFEITITKIEKEWHALEKRIPKPNPKPPQTHRPRSSSAAAVNGEPQAGEEQDSKCAICDDGDCENTNAIVFCDGCDLAVHQECYGVPFIPEGQWLCRKCQLIGRGIPTCIFCPNTDGAFKQTNSSKWAHLLCAMWIPEVSLGNHTFMEPVMDVEKVPKTRWRLTCYLCNQKMGACIQCGNKACYQAFHVTCARRARLYLKMKNSLGTLAVLDGTTVLKAFCDKHCPAEYSKENDVAGATREARSFYKKTMKGRLWADSQAAALAMAATHRHHVTQHPADESQKLGGELALTLGDPKKANQPGKPIWKLPSGAPVIPNLVYEAVESSLARFNIRKRKEYAADVCRYWTLKREARRGAPLLKRLQLQMETFSSMEMTRRNFAGMGPVGRSRLDRRIQFAEKLVGDMANLKDLTHATKEREREKLQKVLLEEDAVDTIYFPVTKLLPPILEKSLSLDIKKVFTKGFLDMQTNCSKRTYVLATAFTRDFALVISKGIEEGIPYKPAGNQQETIGLVLAPKNAGGDIKVYRALGKRIIRAIQEKLETAVHAEAEIISKPADKMIQEMRVLLEECLQPRHESVSGSVDNNKMLDGTDAMAIDSEKSANGDGNFDAIADADMDADDTIAVHDPMEVDNPDDGEASNDNDADIAGTAGGQDTEVHIEQPKPNYENGVKSSDTPPDSNGYLAVSEHQQPPPPTPPISNGGSLVSNGQEGTIELANSLTEGGVPWYMKEFDPVGTTVLENKWSGREAAQSEELSEIDDDELNDMSAAMEGMDGPAVAATAAVEEKVADVAIAAKKSKAKKKKRNW